MRNRRRFRHRRRRVAKKPVGFLSGALGLAKKAWRGFKWVKSLINVEHKQVDSVATNSVGTTAVIGRLSQIAGGDDINNRDGRSVKAVSLSMHTTFVINASATTSSMRQIIFIDWQYNGADTTATDLIASSGVLEHYSTVTLGRFHVLSDEVITLDNVGQKIKNIERFIQLGHHIRYRSTASTAAGGDHGQVMVYHVSDEAVNTPTIAYQARLIYIDN